MPLIKFRKGSGGGAHHSGAMHGTGVGLESHTMAVPYAVPPSSPAG